MSKIDRDTLLAAKVYADKVEDAGSAHDGNVAMRAYLEGYMRAEAALRESRDALVRVERDADQMRDGLWQLQQWADAYPLSVFPEPDFKRAAEVLKAAGMTIDAISASNMRHVIVGVRRIVDAAMNKGAQT